MYSEATVDNGDFAGNGTWGDWGDFGGNGTFNGTWGDWGDFGGNGTAFNGTFGGFGNSTFGNGTAFGFGNGTYMTPCGGPDPLDFTCLYPRGVTGPNYNDAGLGPRITGTAVVMAVLATLAVAFRLWARSHINKRIQLEDWIITLTIPFTILASVCCWYGVRYGAGRHWWNIHPDTAFALWAEKFPYTWVWGHCYWIIALLAKVSIIRFYFRLSPSQRFRRCLQVAMTFIILSGLAVGITGFLACLPIRANWAKDPTIEVKCINTAQFYRAHSMIHIVGDLIVLILPLPMLFRMDRPWMQKLHVIGVFFLGGFVAVCSIVRFAYVELSATPKYIFDASYWGSYIMIWTTLELNVGIICACLPAIKHGLSYLFPSIFAMRTSSHSAPPSLPAFTEGSGFDPKRQSLGPASPTRPRHCIEGLDQLDDDDDEDEEEERVAEEMKRLGSRNGEEIDLEKVGGRFEVRQRGESEERIIRFEMKVLSAAGSSESEGVGRPEEVHLPRR